MESPCWSRHSRRRNKFLQFQESFFVRFQQSTMAFGFSKIEVHQRLNFFKADASMDDRVHSDSPSCSLNDYAFALLVST